MFVKFRRDHHIKLLLGAPVVFLFFLSGTSSDPNVNLFLFETERSPFIASGETITVSLSLDARTSVNAVGETISYNAELLEVVSTSMDRSVIDIWAESPTFDNSLGILHLSGGFIRDGGYTGKGILLDVTFRAKSGGIARLNVIESEILANDGIGTNRANMNTFSTMRVFVSDKTHPSLDQNNDGRLSLADAQSLYLGSFRAYDARRDLNQDGKISWGDVTILLATINE